QPPDFEEINRFCGTSLKNSEIIAYSINPIIRRLINLDPDPGSFQKMSYLMRVCRRMRKNYDVIISANDEIDFGCKGIQYLHYPHMHEKIRPILDFPWYRKLGGILNGNYRPWMLISAFSYDRMKKNITLVNSNWTGNKVREFYGIEPRTVYPPVPGDFPDVSWEKKENGFVCIGRFHPVKRFEMIIEILGKIKMKNPELHLHIIGTKARESYAYNYYEQLHLLSNANASWVFLNENLSREELIEVVAKHRYGIHAHQEEHFGIAVAEMLKGGCIPFVPNDGGQVEIVGGDERLVYRTEEEAIEKITRVMSNPEEQTLIRSYLNSRMELFSTETFMSQIREIVRGF
ncbi:MAG: glycosyltransferase, partial [Thermodesulfobacteriota bacterium]